MSKYSTRVVRLVVKDGVTSGYLHFSACLTGVTTRTKPLAHSRKHEFINIVHFIIPNTTPPTSIHQPWQGRSASCPCRNVGRSSDRVVLNPGDAILTAKGSVLEMEELNIHGRTVRTWKRVSAELDVTSRRLDFAARRSGVREPC